MSLNVQFSPQGSSSFTPSLTPVGALTKNIAQVGVGSPDEFPLPVRVEKGVRASQVFDAAGSPLPVKASLNLGKRKIEESPFSNGTPELFARLEKLSSGKPLSAKPTTNEKKVLEMGSSIIKRQALRSAVNEGDLAERMFGVVEERCSSLGDSPYTRSKNVALASDRSQWLSSFTQEVWKSIPPKLRPSVRSSVRPAHLETAGSRGAGFHILPHQDSRWKTEMRNVTLSPEGVVLASFTPSSGVGFKNSSFFPPYNPSMDVKGVIKCIDRSAPLVDYKSKKDIFLFQDPVSGITIEKVINPKNPVMLTSAYPIFYFGKSGQWQTQASILLAVDCSLGADPSSVISITPDQMREAIGKTIKYAIENKKVESIVKYQTGDTFVLEVAPRLPGNLPQGCYVECPKGDFSREVLVYLGLE